MSITNVIFAVSCILLSHVSLQYQKIIYMHRAIICKVVMSSTPDI